MQRLYSIFPHDPLANDTPDNVTARLYRRLAASLAPEREHSIWYYVGGSSFLLLVIMAASGVLLSFYYEPGAAPAVTPDGTPLATSRLIIDDTADGKSYRRGDLIALPLDVAAEEVIAPEELKGSVETLKDQTTGRAIRPALAWASIEMKIMRDVEFGQLIRSVHVYSSHLLIVSLSLYLFGGLFMAAYRRPRAAIWITGGLLLLLVLAFAFTGSLLPWNVHSYYAAQVGTSLPESSIPLIGPTIGGMLRGGTDVGGTTLTRAYAMHVIVLPLATILLVGLHLLLQLLTARTYRPTRHGRQTAVSSGLAIGAVGLMTAYALMADRFSAASPLFLIPLSLLPVALTSLLVSAATSGFFAAGSPSRTPLPGGAGGQQPSGYLYRHLICWVLTIGLIATVATLAPWHGPQGSAAAPVDLTLPQMAIEGARPEWYFLWLYQLLQRVPEGVVMMILLLVGTLWFALPWLDRRRADERQGMGFRVFGIALLIALLLLTVWGYTASGG